MAGFTTHTLPILLLSTSLLTACGGGSSSGGGLLPPDPPEQRPTNAGGIWEGTITSDLDGTKLGIVGAVTEGNTDARFLTEAGVALVLESVTGNGGELTATLTAFAPPGSTFSDGSSFVSGGLAGTVVERNSLQGEWTLDNGDSGSVLLSYDAALYERESSLDFTAGLWLDSFAVLYSVDSNGVLFAQDFTGCVYNGQVSIVDARFNVYDMSIIVSNCPGANGAYEGLGAVADEFGINDAFIVQLDNGVFAIADILLRPGLTPRP